MTGQEPGSRLRCEKCGTEVVVMKIGDSDVSCCQTPMQKKA